MSRAAAHRSRRSTEACTSSARSRIAAAIARAGRARARRAARVAQRPARRARRVLAAAVDAFVARRDEIAPEITWQMGRPLRDAPGEVRGFEERARCMLDARARGARRDLAAARSPASRASSGASRSALVVTIAPWNYPYLTAVNSVVPALAAGNAVILRHSSQTPALRRALRRGLRRGGPAGRRLRLRCTPITRTSSGWCASCRSTTSPSPARSGAGARCSAPRPRGASRASASSSAARIPAYVRPDADLGHAVAGLVDGAFFNAGQSCCGIERIYVHEAVYARSSTPSSRPRGRYRLGDPRDPGTTLGPMVRASAAEFVRGQVAEALAAGREGAPRPGGLPRRRAGHALPRAAGPRRRRPLDARHDRGDLRPRRRNPEGRAATTRPSRS